MTSTAGRALVVGGAGFLGRNVVAALARSNWDITVLTRRAGSSAANARMAVLDHRLSLRVQFSDALGEIRPDVVVNAAGEIWQRDVKLLWAANIVLPGQLARAMADTGSTARLIHLGSSLEYGSLSAPAATDESCPTTPRAAYGRAKLRGTETVLEFAHTYSVNAVVLRVFNAIGAGMSPVSLLGRTVQTLAEARGNGCGATIRLADLAQYRDYVDARDVADAVLATAVHHQIPSATIFNIGSAVARSAEEIVYALAEASGVDYQISKLPGNGTAHRSTDVSWQVADTGLAKSSLGWSPCRRLPDTLRWIWQSEWTKTCQVPIKVEGTR